MEYIVLMLGVSQECLWLSGCGVMFVDAVVLAGGHGPWQLYVLINIYCGFVLTRVACSTLHPDVYFARLS